MMNCCTFPPNALRRPSRILLYTTLRKPGILHINLIIGFSTCGFILALKIFSITKGTVMSRYGFTSANAFSSAVGVGALPNQ